MERARLEVTGGEAQPAQRDERVAAPVAEPRIARDQGAPFGALHEVARSPPLERPREGAAPRELRLAQPIAPTRPGFRARAADRPVSPRSAPRAPRRRSMSNESTPGDAEIFVRVETARGLLGVEKAAIPIGRVLIRGVRQGYDRRHPPDRVRSAATRPRPSGSRSQPSFSCCSA